MTRRYCDREIETMAEDDLRRLQLSRLNDFLEQFVVGNPWFQARGFPSKPLRHLSELGEMPRMSKQDVLADVADHPPFGRRLTAEEEEIRQVVETSGTSGSGRERYPLTALDMQRVIEMEVPGFVWGGLSPGDRLASSLPVTTRAGGQWYHDAVRHIGAVWLSLGTYPAEEKLRYIQQLGAHTLVASASYLLRIEAVCASLNVNPASLNLTTLMTAGEPYSVDWAKEREEVWGARLHEQYGSTQRAIAWCCEEGAIRDGERGVLHFLPHLAVYEVIDPGSGLEVADGEVGELLITPFASSAAPLVRFATGDRVTKVGAGDCPCDRPFPGIRAGAIDRFDAMVKLRGVNVHQSMADSVIIRSPITDYRARVYTDPLSGREQLEIRVTSVDGTLNDEALGTVARRFRDAFGLRAMVTNAESASFIGEFGTDSKKHQRWVDERSTSNRKGD